MIFKKFLCVAGLLILVVFYGCDLLNNNDADENDNSGASESLPSTYTTAKVLGTWTLTKEIPAIETTYKCKLIFTSADYVYIQDMFVNADSSRVWSVTGIWSLADNIVTLLHENCVYFGVPWDNCNDVDDTAEFVTGGYLKFDIGDFEKQ